MRGGATPRIIRFTRPEAYPIVHAHSWSQDDANFATHQKRPVNGEINLAQALKFNPHLHADIEAGYYDFATPYFGMEYSVHHREIPKDLQSHVQWNFHESGHMIHVRVQDLKKMHDNVAKFIDRTHHT